MSSYNALFALNKTGELEVNKPEAKSIEEFKVLFDRDKGSKGDLSGAKKALACAELHYIYLTTDVRSIYYNLPLLERKPLAIKDAKLPSNWREDKELINATEKYKEMFSLTAAGNAYITAEKAYFTITRDTAELQEELIELKSLLQSVSKRTKAKRVGDTEVMTAASEAIAIISAMAKIQKDIIANIKTFSDLGNSVKILAAKFIEEGGNMKVPVGGGEIGNREI